MLKRDWIKYLILIIGLWSCGKHAESSRANSDSLTKSSENAYDDYIEIPSTLIERIRGLNDSDSSAIHQINKQVFQVAKDSILPDSSYFGVVDPMFIDLDGDEDLELVCLFGKEKTLVSLGVFDVRGGEWMSLFFEDFGHYYKGVEFKISGHLPDNQLLAINNLEVRGSGVLKEVTHFYKLINGDFRHCLRLVSDSHIHGWGMFMNQEVKSNYQYLPSTSEDEILVTYTYAYFPGPAYDNDASWISHPEMPLVSETNKINYKWNEEEMIYSPQYEIGDSGLTQLQLQAFDQFGNDTLIMTAFKNQFDEILSGKSDEKRRIVNAYLEYIALGKVEKWINRFLDWLLLIFYG